MIRTLLSNTNLSSLKLLSRRIVIAGHKLSSQYHQQQRKIKYIVRASIFGACVGFVYFFDESINTFSEINIWFAKRCLINTSHVRPIFQGIPSPFTYVRAKRIQWSINTLISAYHEKIDGDASEELERWLAHGIYQLSLLESNRRTRLFLEKGHEYLQRAEIFAAMRDLNGRRAKWLQGQMAFRREMISIRETGFSIAPLYLDNYQMGQALARAKFHHSGDRKFWMEQARQKIDFIENNDSYNPYKLQWNQWVDQGHLVLSHNNLEIKQKSINAERLWWQQEYKLLLKMYHDELKFQRPPT